MVESKDEQEWHRKGMSLELGSDVGAREREEPTVTPRYQASGKHGSTERMAV